MSLIIAEIGTSHEGSKKKAFELIDASAASGADAVKFQWVYADEILHPDTGFVKLPTGDIPLYERFKQLECKKEFYKEMLEYVHLKNCKFCCSPFGIKSLNELLEINPDIVKIASPELNHYEMLKVLRDYRSEQKKQGKSPVPVILSSGVSKLSDIEKTLDILGTENVSLLHCVTSYPAPEEEYNLKLITNLSSIFGIECGVSDHSLDPMLVPAISIGCGGSIVEKHITLSRQTEGLDDPVALEPEQFALMVHVIHQSEAAIRHYGKEIGLQKIKEQFAEAVGIEKVEKIIGSGIKFLAPAEKMNYGRTNRSLHFMESFESGHIISGNDISILRTEKILTPGISPEYYDLLVGKKLSKKVEKGAGVQLTDFLF
ncbi:MAG: N-acetylneuraminate synthase family protein [Treponema sp.]|nr:N-acetylneuraminate synthase family protein [Treponema sp.]